MHPIVLFLGLQSAAPNSCIIMCGWRPLPDGLTFAIWRARAILGILIYELCLQAQRDERRSGP